MKMAGLSGMLRFLDFLKKEKILYSLHHFRDDSIMVSFALVGHRVEVDFFEDHFEYSVFNGDEAVADDLDWLLQAIRKNR